MYRKKRILLWAAVVAFAGVTGFTALLVGRALALPSRLSAVQTVNGMPLRQPPSTGTAALLVDD